MKEGYRFLGEYIRQVDIRNKEGKKENLLGVSVQKQFIQSIANTVGTDFTKYKIVKKGQFTYIPDTSRRGDKIAIALLEDYEEGLVSKGHDGVRAWFTELQMDEEPVSIPEFLETFTKNALPHHYAMSGGRGEAMLIEACKLLGMQGIKKEKYHDYL